jgi:hypothetical protein
MLNPSQGSGSSGGGQQQGSRRLEKKKKKKKVGKIREKGKKRHPMTKWHLQERIMTFRAAVLL